MINIDKSNNIVYYIISDNSKTIFHFGKVEEGQTLTSGLDAFEQFENEEEFLLRLDQINPNFKNEYLENLNEQI